MRPSLLLVALLVIAGCASTEPAAPAAPPAAAPPVSESRVPARATAAAELTLEKLFASPEFAAESFQGGRWAESGARLLYVDQDREAGTSNLVEMDLENDGRRVLIDGSVLAKPDGEGLVQIEDYAYSADGSKALLYTDSERVWRLNTKGYYYVFDLETNALRPVADRSEGLQMFAKFDPAAQRVAFVRDRNLYVVDLATGDERALTTSGGPGAVINGTFDWVYEEEFGLRDGFRWSPDGRYIAFFQLDESATRDFQMTDFRTLYPETTSFRYPKAGEANAEVRVGVVDVATGETTFFDTDTWFEGGDETEYLAGMGWTPALDDGRADVWMLRLNRDQNHADLLYGDPETGDVEQVLEEENDSYIEVETGFSDVATGTITYLDDGDHFVWRSDRDGYGHLYLYDNDGAFVRQVTRGPWDVTDFHGVDEAEGVAYVTTTAASPLQRHLYRVPLGGGEPEQVTSGAGWHSVDLSRDFDYFTDTYSTATAPPTTTLYRTSGEEVAVLVDNEDLAERIAAYGLPAPEFTTVPGADGEPLNAYVIRPSDFDASREYPLLIHTYGGPGSQEVTDRWAGTERLWHQYLAETHGILVAGVDNRGTGGRGKAFKTETQNRLGILEAEDQIAAAQHFGAMPYVDSDRMGIWGWSYGGYLTLLAMTYDDGPETFHAGAAVAPVTSWRQYDTIYTERYLSTPQKNPGGYDLGSPTTYADRLAPGQDLLIVHGDADDNVHVQNSYAMVDALQAAGKQFDLMIYPGRNHGIYGGGTRLHLYTLLTDFFAESLGGAGPVAQR
ncbi:S9 family peptidase [Rubrivirga sp. S365]|uniref:S9 family peptidase n=1 Tax=Rubrivirga sp. S365 TaxID=3076080 RepID=UPI0028C51F4A|nr:S9 family peptidase [Rubrivirga sp. S365]MDT7856608.1 S9 family peptidase [Rubrivirga sp. S365]